MAKITFQDLPNTTTPINASNLNAMQTNTENAIADAKQTTPAQANTNFNDLSTTGTYFFGSVPTGNNKPATTGLQSGVLEVFKHSTSSLILQRYTNFDGSKIYVRGSYQGGWSAWKTITPS